MKKNSFEKQIINYYDTGLSATSAAKRAGCSYPTARKWILKKYKILRPRESYRKYNFNTHFFDNINQHSSYWLGYILADGHVRNNVDKRVYQLCFNIAYLDKMHIKQFCDDINIPHSAIKEKYTTAPSKNGRYGNFKMIVMSASSKHMVNEIGNKLKNYKELLTSHFIRGFLDGDGYVSTTTKGQKRFGFYSPHADLLEIIRDYLHISVGLGRPSITKNRNIYGVHFNGNKQAKKAYKFLYKNADRFLERKRIKW